MNDWYSISSLILIITSAYFVVVLSHDVKKHQSIKNVMRLAGYALLTLSLILMLMNTGTLKPVVVWLALVSLLYMVLIVYAGYKTKK